MEFTDLKTTILQMLAADITAAVLISFGAFYGFTSPSQIIIITLIEIFMCVVNEHIGKLSESNSIDYRIRKHVSE